jgi:hypothetical protein
MTPVADNRMERATELQERLIAMARQSAWMMPALSAVRQLGLASWCIGAGAVRNLVWDALHGISAPTALADFDVAYFDAAALSPQRDAQLQARLGAILPGVSWEVTNQATVHHWFEDYFGYPAAPLLSLEDAVASWPEYATSVGLTLEADGAISVIAPHGLDDLFALVVRRNPARVSIETYRQRIGQKRYAQRWPKVTIVP